MVEKSTSVVKPSYKGDWRKQVPAMKVSTEYDSEGGAFVNKISANIFNGLAKLKTSFERSPEGDFSYPFIGVVTKYLSLLYDYEDKNALVTASTANLLGNLQLKYLRDIKAEQGKFEILATSSKSNYKSELAFDVPSVGLDKATFTFPLGEIKVEEEFREDETKALSISGFAGKRVLHGLIVGGYRDENFDLKYTFKDAEMTLTPSIQWPSQSFAVTFKRQFDASNKLSYRYNFDSTTWNTVYKNKANEDLKVKLGYDSQVRLFWGSLWVGKEGVGAKRAPRKCRLQVMLQVPQDDVHNSALLFRVKKRWDI